MDDVVGKYVRSNVISLTDYKKKPDEEVSGDPMFYAIISGQMPYHDLDEFLTDLHFDGILVESVFTAQPGEDLEPLSADNDNS